METLTNPNYRINNVELNWAKLDPERPVEAFGNIQWELQIATTDAALAKEMTERHLNVKEKDGKFVVSLKRKAFKKDQSPSRPVVVVGADTSPLDPKIIGNGSIGNVEVYQYNYDMAGRKGIGTMLSGVQVVNLVPYNAAPSTGFEVVSGNTTPEAGEEAPMF
jgi:hypothetical protein